MAHVGCLNSDQATGNLPLTSVMIGERNVYQDFLDPECASISQLEANDPKVLPSQKGKPLKTKRASPCKTRMATGTVELNLPKIMDPYCAITDGER